MNGARRGELYSKYTYYHSYYTPKEDRGEDTERSAESTALSAETPAEVAKPKS